MWQMFLSATQAGVSEGMVRYGESSRLKGLWDTQIPKHTKKAKIKAKQRNESIVQMQSCENGRKKAQRKPKEEQI